MSRPSPTQQIIATLLAAFPTAKIGAANLSAYVLALSDIPPDELLPVCRAIALEARWFPSIREIRRAVTEARLGLPDADTAWELAIRYAGEPGRIRCDGGCDGGLLDDPDAEPITLDTSELETISNLAVREALERAAAQARRPKRDCPRCQGEGEIRNPRRPELPEPVRRALDHVGGAAGIGAADNLSVIRAQFLKAYERRRDEDIRRESLESAGLGQLGPALRAELGAGS